MNEPESNYHALKEWALAQGVALFGAAHVASRGGQTVSLSATPANAFTSGIVLGVRLLDAVLEDIDDRPTELYLHHYRQANFFLDRIAFELLLR